MTVYFQFNKDIGGKVVCMENLCALNPLDQFFIDLGLVKTLFYEFPIGGSCMIETMTDDDLDENSSLLLIEKSNIKKYKPLFKKVISQEISKLISKGLHSKISIRDVISNKDIESKVQYRMGV